MAITDSPFSPLAQIAEPWIEVGEANFEGFRSMAATLTLAMTLTVAIAGAAPAGSLNSAANLPEEAVETDGIPREQLAAMTAFPDHYAALGIDPTADQEVIAAAYRALAKKYHPDTGATTGTASAERFAEIQQAYEVLGSAEGRRRYDADLLEATQRELDEHLARKQRKIAGATGEPPPPRRPISAASGRSAATPGRSKWNPAVSIREMGPFLVVSGLLMAVAGGFASLFLSQAPLPPVEEPPLPPDPAGIEATRTCRPLPHPRRSPPQQQAALPERDPAVRHLAHG